MTSQNEATAPQEIVIVRRRSNGDDEGHHGSAWKIAYADFVTAMMAFFLVMWLINSSDKQTVTQVAAYFNPIKLNSKNPSSKGIEEAANAKGVKAPEEELENQTAKTSTAKSGSGDEPHDQQKYADLVSSEQKMFADPFQALNEISLLQDPFAWATSKELHNGDTVDKSNASKKLAGTGAKKAPVDPIIGSSDQFEDHAHSETEKKLASAEDHKKKEQGEENKQKALGEAKKLQEPAGAQKKNELSEVKKQTELAEAQKAKELEEEKKRKELENKVRDMLAVLEPNEKPLLQFKKVKDGILITLTDQFDFSMFRRGSAKPRPQLIKAIEAVAKSLESMPGEIVIRGHTDATKYTSKLYDNWRLSTARAQMARYMLVRGGLKEKRIARIEGYGARLLRIKSHPTAAENRRIEILLRN